MIYTGCEKCTYDSKRTDEYPCNECVHGASVKEHFKPMTNADRIRNMSDEELAEFLLEVNSTIQHCMIYDCKYEDEREGLCKDCFLEWLQAEVKEGGEDE